ncbi:ankyrin repeat domain-containing protein [Streptomyces niveus]|uniref:ankyrin repeat domain-containing protein n=1 Tax=Streptomyces niveus TaxID=193462 RepID=UPI0036442B2D
MTGRSSGWDSLGWAGWEDHAAVKQCLDQGADPDNWRGLRPLHRAAAFGSPEVVAELVGRVADVDAIQEGVTALWEAVLGDRAESARILAAAGADPWRTAAGGWSPGRLSLAGPTPGLFVMPEGERGLSEAERATAQEGRRLVTALGREHADGMGLACVAGIDAEEAIRRLEATPVEVEELAELVESPYAYDFDEKRLVFGVTTVPGGCVVTQPWGYGPSQPGVLKRLSAGTLCYGLYANPKSGNQGSITRDGVTEGWDLHPGGGPNPDDTPEQVLASYLFRYNAVAYACAFVGLRPTDSRSVDGRADIWVELPDRDYW